jgi:tetratricopeptide (TPR) repeat protein
LPHKEIPMANEQVGLDATSREVLAALARSKKLAVLAGAAISRYSPSALPLGGELRDMVIVDCVQKSYLSSLDGIMRFLSAFPMGPDLLLGEPDAFQRLAPEVVFAHFVAIGIDPVPFIRTLLGQATEPNECHRLLAQLLCRGNIRALITTNFDELIETTTSGNVRADLLTTTIPGTDAPTGLYKLHGTLSVPTSIQIAIQHVALGLSEYKQQFLSIIGASCDLLVVGYSGLDPDIFPNIRDEAKNRIVWLLRPRARWPVRIEADDLEPDEAHLVDLKRHLGNRLTFIASDAYLWLKLLQMAMSGTSNEITTLGWPQDVRSQRIVPVADMPSVSLSQAYELLGRLHMNVGNFDYAVSAFKYLILAQFPEAYPGQMRNAANFLYSIDHLRAAYSEQMDASHLLSAQFLGVPPVQYTITTSFARASDVSDSNPMQDSPIETFTLLIGAGKLDDAVDIYYRHIRCNIPRSIELLSMLFDDMVPKQGFEDQRSASHACNLLGNCYSLFGEPAKSKQLHEMAARLASTAGGYSPNLVTNLISCAECDIDLGELQAAERTLKYCIELAPRTSELYPLLCARRALGLVYAVRGEAQVAESHFQSAIDMCKDATGDTLRFQSITWRYRAINLWWAARYAEASQAVTMSDKLVRRTKLPFDEVGLGWIKGSVQACTGQPQNARRTLAVAIKRCKEHGLNGFLPALLVSLGHTMKPHRAQALALQALEISRKNARRLRQAEAHFLLARSYMAQGNRDAALAEASAAVQQAECGYKVIMSAAQGVISRCTGLSDALERGRPGI